MKTYKAFVGSNLVACLNMGSDDEMSKRVAAEIIAHAAREELSKLGKPEFYNRLIVAVQSSDEPDQGDT